MRTLPVVVLLAILGCDEKVAPAEKGPAEPAKVEGEAAPKPADSPTAPAAEVQAVDACALLTVEEATKAIAAPTRVSANPDAVRTIGDFESSCGWQVEGKNRVTLTVARDPEGDDVGRLQKSVETLTKAGVDPSTAPVRAVEAIGGAPTFVRADGALLWSKGGRLLSVSVYDDAGAPLTDDAPRRTLATAADGRL